MGLPGRRCAVVILQQAGLTQQGAVVGFAHQLLVGSEGDDAAPLHDGDAVRPVDGGGPVGDDEHGPAAHQGAQRLLDLGLGVRIGHGGGLVHEEDGGVQQEGAGDGDALLLPAR